ncbi:hypothetical protein SynMEDNS5_02453 [Synechococcus sp. MEDNS5]|nr:hypothetical protein SynMEDNS5_02453 [Synechococcus sp. MEDNS5]
MAELVELQHCPDRGRERQSSHEKRINAIAMREFFVNVTRYPRYLIAFSLGVLNSVAEPLARRRSNPVTAVALIGALISGFISLGLVLRAMVSSAPMS